MVESYRDLDVWQRSIQLVKRVYAVVAVLPKEERFALGDQLRRSVVSVPANIAEGWARRHTREYLRHLSISCGSLAEVETLLAVAIELEYVKASRLTDLNEELDHLGRMINRLQQSLRKRLKAK